MTALATILEEPHTIQPEDEDALRAYMRIGGVIGARSPMGPLLDRARLFAPQVRPCTTCGGNVALDRPGRGTVWSDGSGKAYERALLHEQLVAQFLRLDPESELDPGLYGAICTSCRGMGWVVDSRRQHAKPDTNIGGYNIAGEPVFWAKGAVRETCTARPMGSSVKPWVGPEQRDMHSTLTMIGVVSRRLRAIGEQLANVLHVYYLATEVRETPRAVWPLTPSGRTMLRAYERAREEERQRRKEAERKDPHVRRSPPKEEIGPWQAIQELVAEQAAKPTANRRVQFAAADEQATALIDAARTAWVQAVARELNVCVDDLLRGGLQ